MNNTPLICKITTGTQGKNITFGSGRSISYYKIYSNRKGEFHNFYKNNSYPNVSIDNLGRVTKTYLSNNKYHNTPPLPTIQSPFYKSIYYNYGRQYITLDYFYEISKENYNINI
jgi:hypothetical protein